MGNMRIQRRHESTVDIIIPMSDGNKMRKLRLQEIGNFTKFTGFMCKAEMLTQICVFGVRLWGAGTEDKQT